MKPPSLFPVADPMLSSRGRSGPMIAGPCSRRSARPRFGAACVATALSTLTMMVPAEAAEATGGLGAADATDRSAGGRHLQASGRQPLLAQAPALTDLPRITVTATRQQSRVDQQVANVTVIDRDEIDRSGGLTLTEILASQAGIQLTSNGGQGATTGLFVRGTEARHVLLLIDGVRYGSATAGGPVLNAIPVDQIERIEIVRGPLSSLYGSDAVGGVIQIFTLQGEPGFRPHASAILGSRRFGSIAAGVSGGDERWDYAFTAQHQRNRGFSATNDRVPFGSFNPDDDGFRQSSVAANVGWKFLPDWQARAIAIESRGRTDLDDGMPVDDPGIDSQAKIRSQVISIGVEGQASPRWRPAVRLARSEDRYDTVRSADTWGLGVFDTVQHQYTFENRLALDWANVVVGLERLEQDVGKSTIGYDVHERAINAGFIGVDRSAGAHHLQASARHDRNSQYGSRTTGAAGYGYDLTPQWRVGGSYGTSFVAPTFNQLYYPGFGNPDLRPEQGKQAELFVRYARPGHEVRLARYQSRIRGYIPAGPRPANVPRSRIDGWELAWTAHHGPWSLRLAADWLDPRNEATGARLPRRAKQTGSLAVDRAFGGATVGTLVRSAGDRFDDADNTVRLGGFALVDVYANWPVAQGWSVGARLNNLADRRYETSQGYNQPGRELYLTVRYQPR